MMVSPGAKVEPGGAASSILSSSDEAVFGPNSMMARNFTVCVVLLSGLLVVGGFFGYIYRWMAE